MTVTKESVERFHEFAQQKLNSTDVELSWDELLIAWQSACERETTNAAIREALEDVEAGRYQPVDDAMRELRHTFGIDE